MVHSKKSFKKRIQQLKCDKSTEVPFLIAYPLAHYPEAMAGVPALGDPKTHLSILLLPP